MASLLDFLGGGQGGLLNLPPPNDPIWKAILAQKGLGGPSPAMDPSAIGGAAPDLSGIRSMLGGLGQTLMGPGPNVDLGAMGGALPQDQFGAGAQPTSLYGVNSSGFGFQPPAPNPIPPPTNPQGPPVALLENRPPTREPRVDPNLPPVSRPTQGSRQQPAQAQSAPVGPTDYGGGNLNAGFMNLLHGLNIGNAITGFTTGQRTDPAGAYGQAATQTYRALKAAGYPDADAALAATNPDVLKQIVTNAYQQPKFEKAGPGESAYLVGGGQGRLGPGGGGPSGVGGAGITQLQAGLTPEQMKTQETLGAKGAENYQALQDKAASGVTQLQTFARLRQLSPQAFAGPGAPAYQQVRSLLSSTFGVPDKAVAAGDEFKMLESQLTLERLGGRLGSGISDADRGAINATVPGLANSPQGRMKMIEIGEKVAQRQIDIGKLADQWIGQNGSMRGFQGALADWSKQNPLFAAPAEGPGSQSVGNWTQVTPNIRVRPVQ